jgi:PBP1b-binding outer membrane lipoprotein LpoB
MKKFLAIILFVSFSAIILTSCTDEEVAPKTETHNNGGSPIKEG